MSKRNAHLGCGDANIRFPPDRLRGLQNSANCAIPPNMNDDSRISFSGHQSLCVCDSEQIERVYNVTIRVKKGLRKADLAGLRSMNSIPGSRGRLSICFPESLHTSVGTRSLHLCLEFKIKAEGKEPSTCEAWMSVVSLDDGYLRERERLKGSRQYDNTNKWFK
jgi:hypothetical protein